MYNSSAKNRTLKSFSFQELFDQTFGEKTYPKMGLWYDSAIFSDFSIFYDSLFQKQPLSHQSFFRIRQAAPRTTRFCLPHVLNKVNPPDKLHQLSKFSNFQQFLRFSAVNNSKNRLYPTGFSSEPIRQLYWLPTFCKSWPRAW